MNLSPIFFAALFWTIAIAYAIEDPSNAVKFKKVTHFSQLWRFQVGQGDTITVGDRFIFLYAQNEKSYVMPFSTSVGLSGRWLSQAKIEVEFIHRNKIMLKAHKSQKYFACDNEGSVKLFERVTPGSLFELTISPNGQYISLYNPEVGGALSINNGMIDCTGFGDQRAHFSGWKLGLKSAWQPSDEWQLIGYFDNRFSQSMTHFAYVTSIGVEVAQNAQARVAVPLNDCKEAGFDLEDIFTSGIESKDVMWQTTSPIIWRVFHSFSDSIDVAPNTLTRIFQAVGHYGIYTIRTNYIQARDGDPTT